LSSALLQDLHVGEVLMKPTLFLSYARGEDERFVARLHTDLTAHGFDIWFDRVNMPSRALSFHQEIKDAIRLRDWLLLVVGPKSAASDYVIEEWRFAWESEKNIVSLLRIGDRSLVPVALNSYHCEDFREEATEPRDNFSLGRLVRILSKAAPRLGKLVGVPSLPAHSREEATQPTYAFHLARLVRMLSEAAPRLGKLVGVPSLPAHFLQQPERLRLLKGAALIHLPRPVVITGAAARHGLRGLGGIGKSVLACALARDRQVRQAFPDGVVWLPFGQQPNLVQLQRNLARAFGGNGDLEDEVQGKAELCELLLNKAALLICDDVWEARHTAPFNVLGPRSRLVVTTRDAGLLRALGATEYRVTLLSEDDSLVLLARTSGQDLSGLTTLAREVARECGYLPLALAQCGGMAHGEDGMGWDAILTAMRDAAPEENVLGDPLEGPDAHPWRAISVSVQRFTPDEQRRFAELAVFPEDEFIPESAVRTLWTHTGNMESSGIERLLERFAEHSLIYLDDDRTDPDKPKRRVWLHDLLHDHASRLAGDTAALHTRMLESYRALCTEGWTDGPDDGYFFTHLCWHLLKAGRSSSLPSLLVGSRKWMDVKFERLGSDAGFMADISLCLSQYNDFLTPQQLLEATPLHVVRSVIYERVSRYTYQMTDALIWLRREEQAVNLTRLRPRSISGRAILENRLGYRGAPSLEGQGLLGLISIYAGVYRREGALTMWLASLEGDIVSRIDQLENPEDRIEAVREFLPVLIAAGQHDPAERLCESCMDAKSLLGQARPFPDWKRESLVELLVTLLAGAQRFDRARHWIGRLNHEKRDSSYVSLSAAYADAGALQEAEETLKMVQKGWVPRARLSLALAYARAGHLERARALLDPMDTNLGLIEGLCDLARIYVRHEMGSAAESLTAQIEGKISEVEEIYDWSSTEEQRACAYMALGKLRAELGDATAALSAFQSARDQAFRAPRSHEVQEATVRLLRTMVTAGFHGEAVEIARDVPGPVGGWLQVHVVAALSEEVDVIRAEELALSITEPHDRMSAFLSLSVAHSRRGRSGAASRCFEEAVKAAAGVRDGESFMTTLCAVSHALAEAGHPGASDVLLLASDSLLQAVRADAGARPPATEATSWAFGPMPSFLRSRPEAKTVVMELLRQGHFDQLATLLRAGLGGPGSIHFEELRPIRQHLHQARAHLDPDDLKRLLDFLRVGSLSRPLYCEILGQAPSQILDDLRRELDMKRGGAPGDRDELAADLLFALVSQGKLEEAEPLIVQLGKAPGTSYKVGKAIGALIKRLVSLGRLEHAEALLTSHVQSNLRGAALRYLACEHARRGEHQRVDQLVAASTGTAEEVKVCLAIAQVLVELGDVQRAENVVERAGKSKIKADDKFMGSLLLAGGYGRKGEPEKEIYFFQRSLDEARSISGDFAQEPARQTILKAAADSGRFVFSLSACTTEKAEELIRVVAGWRPGLERLFGADAARIHSSLLQEAIRIVAWVRPEWEPVHDLLTCGSA
jgi:tetratricopeptide (TPR) repeat protein